MPAARATFTAGATTAKPATTITTNQQQAEAAATTAAIESSNMNLTSLVPKNAREKALWVVTSACKFVRVAQRRVHDLSSVAVQSTAYGPYMVSSQRTFTRTSPAAGGAT
jgi:hypothetical protein